MRARIWGGGGGRGPRPQIEITAESDLVIDVERNMVGRYIHLNYLTQLPVEYKHLLLLAY